VCVARMCIYCRGIGQTEWVSLRSRLLDEMKKEEDSIQFYFLVEKAVRRIEHRGIGKPVDLIEPPYFVNQRPRTLCGGFSCGVSRKKQPSHSERIANVL